MPEAARVAPIEIVQDILNEIQSNNIAILDVRQTTSITDYMIVCSGRSSRHVNSIGEYVQEEMKKRGYILLSMQGLDLGEWVLMDYGDFIIHIMQPESRAFYDLEGLWKESYEKNNNH